MSPASRRPDWLRREVEALFAPSGKPDRPGMVGAEVELLAVGADPDRRPIPLHPPAHDGPSVLGLLARWAAEGDLFVREETGGSPWFRGRSGGRITFEPGGQLEYSTPPRPTAAAVLSDLHAVLDPLYRAGADAGVHFVARGLDPWHGLEDVSLQVGAPRYLAMDDYFARIGPHGQRMMRLSAAMQVNLDLGSAEEMPLRWRAALLLTPVLRALFCNSPATDDGQAVPGGRLINWDRADPGRTGVTRLQSEGNAVSPTDAYLEYALQAGVMMLPTADGGLEPGPPGLTFTGWLAGEHRPGPTEEAWRIHLGTLFPDVRPRGWLEIRTLDVPEKEWWPVPLLILPALLYRAEALRQVLDLLEPLEPTLCALARVAPRTGLTDTKLASTASRVLKIAVESAGHFPDGYFTDEMLATTEEFSRTYVSSLRTQADDAPGPRPAL